ncbi:MAG: ribosomal RNA small subunit methyltransferase A [Candidatus Aminicenantes bacterium]|nr:ribosomal RNA small subunit methyltransferase A [Candidatus Aminicenantes bacterium]
MAKRTRRQLLGQHFLHEKKILMKIVEAVDPKPEDLIVEIGPGQGALTFPLAARAGKVVAVEKDYVLIPQLEKAGPSNLEIIAGDILEIDLNSLLEKKKAGFKLIKLAGNLPYHISSQVLFVLLQVREKVERAVFLFQKEVAERIVSPAGQKKYSPLSILLQNYFDTQILFQINPGAFNPPPKVDSACIRLLRREVPLYFQPEEEASFYHFLQQVFHQRRKTLVKNLESAGLKRERVLIVLEKEGVKSMSRAEELPPEVLVRIFRRLNVLFG